MIIFFSSRPFINIKPVQAASSPPVIFFSDMTDGPTSGFNDSSTRGAAITIWGNNFGSSRGSSTLTVGGVALSNDSDFAEWGATTNPTTAREMQRITFYLNSSMNTTGAAPNTTIQVNVNGQNSNTIPFHCRASGNIYFIDVTNGNDSYDGKEISHTTGITGSWKNFYQARAIMQAGDVAYVRAGTYTAVDPWEWNNVYTNQYNTYHSIMDACARLGTASYNNGSPWNTISMAAYPGESPQIGNGNVSNADNTDPSSDNASIFLTSGSVVNNNVNTNFNYWTFSKFRFVMYDRVQFSTQLNGPTFETGLRWVGNDIDITYAAAADGHGFGLNPYGTLNGYYVLGNYFHDLGYPADQHGVYAIYVGGGFTGSGIATSSDNLYIAYNEVYHSSGRAWDIYGHVIGDNVANVYIYDNYIHQIGDFNCPNCNKGIGMVVGGGDGGPPDYAMIGTAYVYNNIITDTLLAGIKLTDTSWGSYGGTLYFWNNTLYNNAYDNQPLSGQGCDVLIGNATNVVVKNNIIYSPSTGQCYAATDSSGTSGDHNLWYGLSIGTPSWSSGDINSNPQFVSNSPSAYFDFSLQATSPAVGAGTHIDSVTTDFYGNARNNPPSMGAIEYTSASSDTTPPAAPSRLSVY